MNSEKHEEFLNKLLEVFLRHRENIKVGGLFGSCEEDLDILLIMKDASWKMFATLCKDLQTKLPTAVFFPTFRIQEFLEVPSAGSNLVHLLVFSSLSVFLKTERPFTSYCIARELVPFIGKVDDLGIELDTRPTPDLHFYNDLLFQTGQIFLLGRMDHDVKLREVRKKLLYIIKFSLLEGFHRPYDKVDFHNLAATLFNLPTIPQSLLTAGSDLFKDIQLWNEPSDDEVEEYFSATASFLRKVEEAVLLFNS